jgi:LPS export ABC transporter protein LptC
MLGWRNGSVTYTWKRIIFNQNKGKAGTRQPSLFMHNYHPQSLSINPVRLLLTILILSIGFFFSSCTPEETAKLVVYEGPLREADNITMYYTEKNRMKVLMKAKKINEFQNGDSEFPEGIFIEFYDDYGRITSTLRANSAFYNKAENKWRGLGDVEVINIEKKQQLNTEELFWTPANKKIFTDKFVTIKLENEILYGTGFDADQDLTNYTMKNIEGEFEVQE